MAGSGLRESETRILLTQICILQACFSRLRHCYVARAYSIANSLLVEKFVINTLIRYKLKDGGTRMPAYIGCSQAELR